MPVGRLVCSVRFDGDERGADEEQRGPADHASALAETLLGLRALGIDELQEEGYDTVEANHRLGFKMDNRDYGIGAQILRDVGVKKIKLISNNPKKRTGLIGYGLEIVESVPIEITPNEHNIRYLTTKRDKMGHNILKHH